MRPIYGGFIFLIICILLGAPAFAQSHFTFTDSTGNNAALAVPLSINPYIGDSLVAAGDEIGVFTPAGLCVGATVWDGVTNRIITVWGDNSFTPQVDGIAAGEQMSFRIWRQSMNREYPAAAIFSSSPPATVFNAAYAVDGLYVLTFLGVPVGPPMRYIVSSDSSSVVASSPVTITAVGLDSNDLAVKSAGRTIHWSKTGTGGSFASATSLTDPVGIATVVFTTSTTSGIIHTVTATDDDGKTGTSSSIVTHEGLPARYRITVSDLDPIAGSSITVDAQITDACNNPIAAAGRTVTWSTTGTGGSFSSPTSITNAGGLATVTYFTSTTAGQYTVTGIDDDAITGTSDTITTVAGPPTHYHLASSSYTPDAGSVITITAQLRDVNDNPVSTPGKTVTWSKTGTGGSFSTATSTTDTAGAASVTFTTYHVAGTAYTITGTDTDALTGTADTIMTVVGPASKYLVTSENNTPAAGTGVIITAQLSDAFNNFVLTAGKTVTWSKTGPGGSFSSGTSTTNSFGIATVTFTTHTAAGTVHTVTGTDNDALTGTTDSITTVVGPAAKYLVTSGSNTPAAGTAVTITAQLTDVNNNPVSTIGKTVTWSKTGTGGSFSTAASTTNSGGTASVTFTTHTVAGTVHTVTGTDTDLLTGTSDPITTVVGPAAKYLVTSESYNPVAGTAITITAQLADQNNNIVTTAGKIVTWSKTGEGGSFSSGSSTTNEFGIATVSLTTHTEAGKVYTATGTDTDGLTGTTDTITTRAGTAVKYLVTSSSNTAIAGSAVTITAQLADGNNNFVLTEGKTVTWSKTGAGGTFANPTSLTNSSGIATVVFTTSTATGITYVITATDNTGMSGSANPVSTIPPRPQLVSPSPGQENVPINGPCIWRSVAGALSYTLQISSDSIFASFTVNRSGVRDTITTVDGLLNSTAYYWRVNARDTMAEGEFSSKQNFTTIIAVPDVPLLVSPADLSPNVPRSPTLIWRRAARASKYVLQVALDQTCTQLVVNDSTLVDTTRSIGSLGNDTTYYWRVCGLNVGGPGGFSLVRSFTTIEAIPPPPELIYPADTATNIAINPELKWKKSAGADSYRLQVSLQTNFATTVVDTSGVTDTTYRLNPLQHSTTYSWRVSSINSAGPGAFSTPRRFTTAVDTLPLPPPPPPPIIPGNDTTDVPINLTILWNSIPGAIGYHVQVSLQRDFSTTIVDTSGVTDTTLTLPSLLYNTKYFCRICAIYAFGEGLFSDPGSFTTTTTSSAGTPVKIVPKEFTLRQNYPNPFNPTTTIEFTLAEDGRVTLRVFDILGHEVITLVDSDLKAGILYQTRLDASQLSTGLYMYRLESGKNVQVRKLILMK